MTATWPTTSVTMSAGCAPSAVRTPISRARCATEYDSTPNSPTPAIASANTPNPTSTTAYSLGLASVVITRSSIVITESSASEGASARSRLRSVGTYAAGSPIVLMMTIGCGTADAHPICRNGMNSSGCAASRTLP